MPAAKKNFPGIFVVIAVSFVVYLTIVTTVIIFHYQKPKKGNANKNIQVALKAPAIYFDPTGLLPVPESTAALNHSEEFVNFA